MTESMIKLFYKSKAVKAIIAYPDKRVRTHWVIPNKDEIKVHGRTFKINDKDMMLSGGVPTYAFVHDRVEPINVYDLQKSLMTAQDYDLAISAHVAEEILRVTNGKTDLMMIVVAVGVITLLAVGGLFYFILTKFTELQTTVTELERLIKLLGGM